MPVPARFSSRGSMGDMAPRASTFLVLREREVVLLRWDPAEEELLPVTDETQLREAESRACSGPAAGSTPV